MENRYTFSIPAQGVMVNRLDSVRDKKASLKLSVIEGGPVYLFRGRLSATDCEAAITGQPEPSFIIGASGTSNTEMSLESDMGIVTLYNRSAATIAVGTVQLEGDC